MPDALILGTKVVVGQQKIIHGTTYTVFGGYIVESSTDGSYNMESEDIPDEAGARKTRIIFNRNKAVTLNLALLDDGSPSDPKADFPEGLACTLTGLTTFIVASAPVSKSKTVTRITVTMSEDFTNTFPA